MIKHSKGFNFGTGGVSTSYWKGVKLSDLLQIVKCKDEAKFVCFEGAEDLPYGKYATSIPIENVLDPKNDMMLAYEMNDARLTPDHGFPIRAIFPGCVGGRMVKWVKNIYITDKESDNHYHIFDNRLLPSIVDIDTKDPTWYKSPDTFIYHMNLNSVIAKPAHDEYVAIESDEGKKYKISGYAYAGGGNKVTRVEISLDEGNTC